MDLVAVRAQQGVCGLWLLVCRWYCQEEAYKDLGVYQPTIELYYGIAV